ncbi:hypothetical protein ACHAQA_000187 [Verticillium albo-atrum]
MWRPRLNFIKIHYAWIVFCSLLAFPVLYPYGNLAAEDAIFFGCSSSTESGLNTVDVNNLKLYQQIFLYIIPVITNLMFINAMVVPVRLYWFRLHLKEAGLERTLRTSSARDVETLIPGPRLPESEAARDAKPTSSSPNKVPEDAAEEPPSAPSGPSAQLERTTTITFEENVVKARREKRPRADGSTLRNPSPRGSDNGQSITPIDTAVSRDDDDPDVVKPVSRTRSATAEGPILQAARSIEKATASLFVLGSIHSSSAGMRRRHTGEQRPPTRPCSRSQSQRRGLEGSSSSLPPISRSATIGRNSRFSHLTEEDREVLGGVEYRALKMLLKFVVGYFVGLHLFGVICLLPWIMYAPPKYTDWLAQKGVGRAWWAIYSAQTMANNLGFTLTPDSMAYFRDATWPMLVMTFLAFAGNTCYPVFLRLCIWTTSHLVPRRSRAHESLCFLLDHPRRCYTLLFPSRPTWYLFAVVSILNFTDVLLIIVLDLDNPAVNDLPPGPRILSALFQAASARHTGTSTINLAAISPAVQFSLLAMMYIAVFPIAISVRASNTYEERALVLWEPDNEDPPDDSVDGVSYVMAHVRNQLSFDLWYIFVGTFLVCVAEAKRIADLEEPAFSVFAVLFEVTSAYGNVGLSLGGPEGTTSMSGHYTIPAKLVVCLMMIRGRHRGLPNALDRAIVLPSRGTEDGYETEVERADRAKLRGLADMTRATVPLVKAKTMS